MYTYIQIYKQIYIHTLRVSKKWGKGSIDSLVVGFSRLLISLSILKILLQTSLHRPLCANGDYLYFYLIYSLQLKILGAFNIVIF